jgi:hypothetical protein
MDRKTITALGLCVGIIFLWTKFVAVPPPPPPKAAVVQSSDGKPADAPADDSAHKDAAIDPKKDDAQKDEAKPANPKPFRPSRSPAARAQRCPAGAQRCMIWCSSIASTWKSRPATTSRSI